MKIQGRDIQQLDQDTLVLQRKQGKPISLLFTALPVGITEELEKELPSPQPPRDGFCRDHKQQFIRDERGRPIPFYNEKDIEYSSKLRRTNRLQTTAMLYRCLENDKNVVWEAKRENFKTSEEFYEAVYYELRTAGFSAGELSTMITFMLTLSRLKEEEVSEARDHFLSEEN